MPPPSRSSNSSDAQESARSETDHCSSAIASRSSAASLRSSEVSLTSEAAESESGDSGSVCTGRDADARKGGVLRDPEEVLEALDVARDIGREREVLGGVAELEDLGVLGRDSVGEPDECAESERTVCCSSLDRRVRGLPRGSR